MNYIECYLFDTKIDNYYNNNLKFVIVELSQDHAFLDFQLNDFSEQILVSAIKEKILVYEDIVVFVYIKHYTQSTQTILFGDTTNNTNIIELSKNSTKIYDFIKIHLEQNNYKKLLFNLDNCELKKSTMVNNMNTTQFMSYFTNT
jgi:hypothetical protein